MEIWVVSEDEVKKLIEKHKRKEKEKIYQTYLKLKKCLKMSKKPKSLSSIVDKMNESYADFIDDFTLGVDKRVVPIQIETVTNGEKQTEIKGWKIQQLTGDVWVDLCNETFNTMEELISRNKQENFGNKHATNPDDKNMNSK